MIGFVRKYMFSKDGYRCDVPEINYIYRRNELNALYTISANSVVVYTSLGHIWFEKWAKETFYNKSFANNWKSSNIKKPHLFRSTSLAPHIFYDNTLFIHSLGYAFCISSDLTAQKTFFKKYFPQIYERHALKLRMEAKTCT